MKQSIGLILLQLIGVLLGFVSIFLIAGNLPPELYAITGVYTIISSLIVVFSNTGIETLGFRELLAWKEMGQNEKVRQLVTQSIVYRTIFGAFVFIPLIAYLLYISKYKFHGEHFVLFFTMGIFSISKATIDSIELIHKAFNNYILPTFSKYVVEVLGKIISILIFLKFGFLPYITFVMFLPFVVMIPLLYLIKEWIDFRGVFDRRKAIIVLKESRTFQISSYISYVYNHLDQLLVSLFLSVDVLASFSISKGFLGIGKTLIENIFDPLVQKLVKYKHEVTKFSFELKKVFKIRFILMIISILFFPFYLIYGEYILQILKLQKYVYISKYLLFIYVSQVAYLCIKVEINYISLFSSKKNYLKQTIYSAFISIICLMFIMLLNVKYLFLNVLISNLILILIILKIYRKSKLY